jgi:ribosomal protein L32
MILQNRQVTVDEVAHQLQISRGSACESIHNWHAFHKVCMMGPKATHRISQRETFGHLQKAFGLLWC